MRLDVFGYTNPGGRLRNEDSFRYTVGDGHSLFVVADGLGGHAHGELASSCVCDTLLEKWDAEAADRAAWMSSAIEEANRRILALQDEKKAVMKSTVAALAIDGDKAVIAHSGDSRIYYLHEGFLAFVTEDHSVAYKKYKAGEIGLEDIAHDEDQSSLLRSLGGTERYAPEIHPIESGLAPGDAFFICSDGVWEYLKDGEILIDLLKAENAEQWTRLLRLRMMDRIVPENDNLTMLGVMLFHG